MEIEGVAVFVTGGSGGLGAVIAAKLAEAGADVAVGYRGGRERAERTAESVQALGRKAASIRLDQNDASSVAAAVEEVARAPGRWVLFLTQGRFLRMVPCCQGRL